MWLFLSLQRHEDQGRLTALSIRDVYLNQKSGPTFVNLPREDLKEAVQSLRTVVEAGKLASLQGATTKLLAAVLAQDFHNYLRLNLIAKAQIRLGRQSASTPELSATGIGQSWCLTNPRIEGNVTVLCSPKHCELIGYTCEKTVGRNFEFLYGKATSPGSIRYYCPTKAMVSMLFSFQAAALLSLLHGRYFFKGSPFWNLLCFVPLKDSSGEVQYWLIGSSNVTGSLQSKTSLLSFIFTDDDAAAEGLSTLVPGFSDDVAAGVLRLSALDLEDERKEHPIPYAITPQDAPSDPTPSSPSLSSKSPKMGSFISKLWRRDSSSSRHDKGPDATSPLMSGSGESFDGLPAPLPVDQPFRYAGYKDLRKALDSSPGCQNSRKIMRERCCSAAERDESAEGVRRDAGESDVESDAAPVVRPSNAFDSSDSDDLSEPDEDDELLEKNTECVGGRSHTARQRSITAKTRRARPQLNASNKTPLEFLSPTMTFLGEGPNLVATPSEFPEPTPTRMLARRRSTKDKIPTLRLTTSRPAFEKNRCTITLEQGDPTAAGAGRRTRKYLVASDLSEESLYAIQWAIGTVLRDGDECMIVSVMETDTKLDSDDSNPSSSEKKNRIANQKDRQLNASMLSRQATALLERTRLNVRILCQAIHSKNARHMLLDMASLLSIHWPFVLLLLQQLQIDYHEPTMVVVGTRGLKKVKGMLLGSVSNYLLQKSSVPVMVTRRPLRLARTVHKKLSSLNRESRVPLSEAVIEKESNASAADDDAPEPADVAEQIKKMAISDHK
ncbi:hypothetical protein P7C70_g8031, partial [Phenoliferia sp. Uapishka_3]